MDLDPTSLEGKTTREVLHKLIDYVVKSDEEMDEKTTRSGDQTDLNIYICDNEGYEIGTLDEWVTHLAESDRITGHAANYVSNHTFNEEVADDNVSLVTITTPSKGREDEFVFVTNDGYLWILTTIHSDWREKTIENFIKYLPSVERLYLSADHLEDLTERIRDSRISGFTAKYHAPNRERDATLTFSGAEPGDLQKAEDTFDAKPTRIEFDQKNSPTTAIQGANTNKGRLTMRSVRDGSEPKAVDTLLGLTEGYQELDRQSFSVEHPPVHDNLGNGFTVDGFTAVELTNPDRNTAEDLVGEIEESVLNGNQYRYGIRDGGRKIRVFDTEYDEVFDVAIEEPDIILYARDSTTALSLRSFVRQVYDELDSTYSLSKSQSPVAIQ
ncbi:hypothetical protein CP556_03955 [Natrinema sp. CBA1119]|uniref:hypothetical protein n=1 Tax=Natrinema sp. CBA1119 TaxID=1608465 RepID=UPI000BF2A9C9|nr:hypothetical protein [Natrinema sp. CBA1119]PGF15365.1 hypothetical protein CP556_03955 [Natrinema sp. CBA1119]